MYSLTMTHIISFNSPRTSVEYAWTMGVVCGPGNIG